MNCFMSRLSLLLTFEHASRAIPAPYSACFEKAQRVLSTHRGYDIGALAVYTALKPLSDFSIAAQYSRLLIDLNRSLNHKAVFSEFSSSLSPEKKLRLVSEVYQPYRDTVLSEVVRLKNPLHIASHTFTPVLGGQIRDNDVGFLYDPRSIGEKAFCERWCANLLVLGSDLKVRMNYPYLGTSDGLPTAIRKSQLNPNYMGVELEVNQRHFSRDGRCQTKIISLLKQSLVSTMEEY